VHFFLNYQVVSDKLVSCEKVLPAHLCKFFFWIFEWFFFCKKAYYNINRGITIICAHSANNLEIWVHNCERSEAQRAPSTCICDFKQPPKILKQIVEKFWKHRNSSFFMPNSFLTWTGPTRPGPTRPTMTLFDGLYLWKYVN